MTHHEYHFLVNYAWNFNFMRDDANTIVVFFKSLVCSDIHFVLFPCSWLGMLPGSWAYVSAGAFGRALIVSS
jgi:hypothetical protein